MQKQEKGLKKKLKRLLSKYNENIKLSTKQSYEYEKTNKHNIIYITTIIYFKS